MFGQDIKAARVQLELSQADVAQKAGVTQTTVSGLECGQAVVSLKVLLQVMHAVRLTLVPAPVEGEWQR